MMKKKRTLKEVNLGSIHIPKSEFTILVLVVQVSRHIYTSRFAVLIFNLYYKVF